MTIFGKSRFPGRLRPFPAVGVDGLGVVVGVDVAGLVLEDLIGHFQVVGPCGLGRFRSQAAPVGNGRGDVDFLAVEGLMMFVGQQILGQLTLADGGPHDAEAAQSALHAIPVHWAVSESVSQRPERDTELAEEQRNLDVLRARSCRA